MKRIAIISIVAGGVTLACVGGFIVVPYIKRSAIRKRLEVAFKDPSNVNSVGGIDKLVVSGAFDKNAFLKNLDKATITRTEAREKAKIIWDNYSAWFSSNQTAIVNAFKGLGHVLDVSKIAYEFYGLYGEELLGVIKTALPDKSQYNLLIGTINKLPKD